MRMMVAIVVILLCGAVGGTVLIVEGIPRKGNIDNAEYLQAIEIKEYEGIDLSSIVDFRENSIKGPQYVDMDSYSLKVSGLVESPIARSRDVSQGITISDGVTAAVARSRDVSQGITISDGVSAAVARSRNVSQGITISDGVVSVRLTGACGGCPMATMTLKNGIERIIREEVPEVKEVVAL